MGFVTLRLFKNDVLKMR